MKSPPVYTCDKSCIGECDKNCIINRPLVHQALSILLINAVCTEYAGRGEGRSWKSQLVGDAGNVKQVAVDICYSLSRSVAKQTSLPFLQFSATFCFARKTTLQVAGKVDLPPNFHTIAI